jgi:protoporphyrinogen oxidase
MASITIPKHVGQVISVLKTEAGKSYGFLISRDTDQTRVFWHSDFCPNGAPDHGDLVTFRVAPPRKRGESPRAKDLLILAQNEHTQ